MKTFEYHSVDVEAPMAIACDDVEEYVETTDKTFRQFSRRLQRQPEQILRWGDGIEREEINARFADFSTGRW